MKRQLPDRPVLKRFTTAIPAAYYNPIRLAQLRDRAPVELILGARGLHAFLDKEVWLISDRNLGDLPVLAWTALHAAGRDGIHRPLPSELVYYHAYAAVIVRTVLPDIVLRLTRSARRSETPAAVVPFPYPG